MRGRLLVRRQLPSDAVLVHPAIAQTDSGYADSDLYRSPRLRKVLGNVVIRVAYDPDWSAGFTDRFKGGEIQAVPSSDPCRIAA